MLITRASGYVSAIKLLFVLGIEHGYHYIAAPNVINKINIRYISLLTPNSNSNSLPTTSRYKKHIRIANTKAKCIPRKM